MTAIERKAKEERKQRVLNAIGDIFKIVAVTLATLVVAAVLTALFFYRVYLTAEIGVAFITMLFTAQLCRKVFGKE